MAYTKDNGAWEEASVQAVPIRSELFSRHKGLLETGILSDKRVLIVGVGSGGGEIALQLAKSGVMYFTLIDPDRLKLHNLVRHVSPLSHVGRYKTKSVRDLLLETNPYCHVETWEEKVSWDTAGSLRELIKRSDLVICALDNRAGRLTVNKLCLDERTPVILGGLHRRACGGQVLFVRPHQSPCYQCFLMGLQKGDDTEEMPGPEDIPAYSDRPAPIEPGLSVDTAPVSLMIAKLSIQELLRGKPTTLGSLYEDLTAPLFLWLNRREPDSPYAKLEPMGFNVDRMTILRWYGIPLERHPGCPCCGDYEGYMASKTGIAVSEEAAQAFAAP